VPGLSLSDAVYARLLTLRTGLRHFQRWSEQQARAAGLTPAQHQLLLAVRGHTDLRGPTVGEVADYLLLRHHSVVGLIDRAEEAGLIQRLRDPTDHRVVRLQLTDEGAERLEGLSAQHLEELERLATQLPWEGLGPVQAEHGFSGPPASKATARHVEIARVYEAAETGPALRVLVDRLWPRGLARSEASFDKWMKSVAPSSELRKWYGHRAERFDEFGDRYRAELAQSPASEDVDELRHLAEDTGLVLLTATKDLALSHAIVLSGVIMGE
jgi:uncharacterized protein YeaO (DUF488 family)/DNA-binding MarR family transcriptional regulator